MSLLRLCRIHHANEDCGLQGQPAVERSTALQEWIRLLIFELLHTISQVHSLLTEGVHTSCSKAAGLTEACIEK